jgi:hypothetical protein
MNCIRLENYRRYLLIGGTRCIFLFVGTDRVSFNCDKFYYQRYLYNYLPILLVPFSLGTPWIGYHVADRNFDGTELDMLGSYSRSNAHRQCREHTLPP